MGAADAMVGFAATAGAGGAGGGGGGTTRTTAVGVLCCVVRGRRRVWREDRADGMVGRPVLVLCLTTEPVLGARCRAGAAPDDLEAERCVATTRALAGRRNLATGLRCGIVPCILVRTVSFLPRGSLLPILVLVMGPAGARSATRWTVWGALTLSICGWDAAPT